MSKITDFLDKIEKTTETDLGELATWMQGKTPLLLTALQQGYKITNAFVTAAQSPTGIVVEDLIASVVPQSKPWTADAIVLATKMGNCMKKVSDDLPSVEGIAVRYLGELVTKIHGVGILIDDAILEAQKMFIDVKTGIPLSE